MSLTYPRPLFIMPFDHRHSFVKAMYGFTPPLTADQTAVVIAGKTVIYDGLKLAVKRGVAAKAAGVLVDEEFGGAILRDAKERGFVTCVAVEKSGQEEFAFEYGDEWRQHIDRFAPTFAKALLRYNPEGDAAMNRRQAARLQQVADYSHQRGYGFLVELLIPMTPEQSRRLDGDQKRYDRELRPPLMIAAIEELQQAGVEPDIWKIEGLDRRADCEAVVAAARRGGRDAVDCIVLGRGSDEKGILGWLRAAAPVPGFIGFAVGRTTFWDALARLRAGEIDREAAVSGIAERYAEWVRTFISAREGLASTLPIEERT